FSTVQTIRVRREELDKLMNLVGELVINKIQLLSSSSEHKLDFLKTTLDNIDRLTSELQDLVMRIRMVPIGHIFNRFPRLVRDIARKLGKKVNFIMEGKEIEVDRTVLDEIGEPILHLLRNAIDHGIEPPNKREEVGKPPEGIVKLTAERKRDHILITVEDDGAGLDPEKIKRKALEKGVISEAEANAMTTQQLIDLIFLPGFSTSEKVTETSGRGVGMDIVKTKIEALGGTVQIESAVGKGTKVTLMLPLTLAIIKAMLIKAANQTYAIPLSQIAEVIHIEKSELKKIGNIKAINLRGKVLPVFHLRRLLGYLELETENYTAVIINREPINFGLIIDSIVGMQEIVIKTLDESLKKIEGIAGVTILGDGQVVLILDPANLIAKKRRINMFQVLT
ncbi:chemotaxis protein CheA, partial [Candidatus Bathyarchaeota archaeon]|nr:chemotaxis protein CheA [Candidatus Bathyarchaeota archaeon]